MAIIICYQKASDAYTTYTLRLPDNQPDPAGGADLYATELCTLDGITYVSLPDGLSLPEQPAEIADSIAEVTLTAALRERIKAASPHCQLIQQRVVERIRARYSIDDEIKLLRIAPSVETTAWNAFVEECRQWGRDERAKLGLA